MRNFILLLSALLLTSFKGYADKNDAIVFNDFIVGQICVDNWDTSGDGLLSYAEAAAVKSLDGKFKQRFDICTFNEFQYFTGITETGSEEFAGSLYLTDVTLPSSLKKLGDYTFYGCGSLKNVKLNEGLQTLGTGCFRECSLIKSFYLPESIEIINEEAFMGCQGITEIYIPSKVKEIKKYTFYYCSKLKDVWFPDGLEILRPMSFMECEAIESVYITPNISLIDGAFVRCTGIKDYFVTGANPYLMESGGNVYTKDGKALVAYAPANTKTEFECYFDIEQIRDNAFCFAKNLVKINIPETVDSIGESAFYGCDKLESINLPKKLRTISKDMLRDCVSLKGIEIPENVSTIGEFAFCKCHGIKEIHIPESVKSIDYCSFFKCDSMNTIYVYSKTGDIKNVESSALIWDETTENNRTLYVPMGSLEAYKAHPYWKFANEIKEIDFIQFEDENAEKLCLENWDANGDGKLSISEAAAVTSLDKKFYNNMDIVHFDEFKYFTGITETAEEEFAYSYIKNITLPESIRTLGRGTFKNCYSLLRVNFNEGLEKIGVDCFYYCSHIDSLIIPDNVSEMANRAFMYCEAIKEFKVPANTTVVSEELLEGCNNLEKVIIGDNVKSINSYAFNRCSSLATLSIGKSLETFGTYVFSVCPSLNEITVDAGNENFKVIDNVLYSKDMKRLIVYCPKNQGTEYTVPEGVEELYYDAFAFSPLKKINLPESLENIYPYALSECENLESIELPLKVTRISQQSFFGCTSLKSIKFSPEMKQIRKEAFALCSSLESIVLPETLTEIGEYAFHDCVSMNKIISYSETGEIDGLDDSKLIPDYESPSDNKRVVYVPFGCKAVYEAHPYWGRAHEIIEMEDTAVDGIEGTETVTVNGIDVAVGGTTGIYTLEGTLFTTIGLADKEISLPAGIYIINGKKIVVR